MKKIRLLVLIYLTLCLSLTAALASSRETFVKDINTAFASLAPYPMASQKINNLTVDQAYDIQNDFINVRLSKGDMIIGYKAGLTAAPAQKRFGLSEAVRGTLLKSMLRWPGTLFQKNYGRLFIETEIGFKFGKDIKKPVKEIASLKKAVSIVFPVIELPDLFYSDMRQLKGQDIIATNVAARQVLIGKALPVRAQDLNAVSVTLFHNGQQVSSGVGKNALGDQWKALQWAVNNVLVKGGEIKSGYIVITGSLTKLMPVKPGKYLADFGDFGTMAFEYK